MKKTIEVYFVTIILAIILIAGCTDQNTSQNDQKNEDTTQVSELEITSTAFVNGGNIPDKYSCDHDGVGISPPLNFSNIPEGTQSLVLIFDDPDASGEIWVHWIVFNIPADTTGFEENEVIHYYIGTNSWGEIAYGGPCPPSGVHRYYFRLYALDTELNLLDGATREEIDYDMIGHIIGQTSLMGKYSA